MNYAQNKLYCFCQNVIKHCRERLKHATAPVCSILLLPYSYLLCLIFFYISSAHSLLSLNRTYLTPVLGKFLLHKDTAVILVFSQKSPCHSNSMFDSSPVHLDCGNILATRTNKPVAFCKQNLPKLQQMMKMN